MLKRSMLSVQLGVFHYSRLRMEGDLWAYPLPLDDMGPWRSALRLNFLSRASLIFSIDRFTLSRGQLVL